MNTKPTLWARIKQGGSEYKLVKVPTERNGKPIQPQEPENAIAFYFRYTEPVPGSTRGNQVTRAAGKGTKFADAVKMLRYKEIELEAAARGLNVPAPTEGRLTLAAAAEQFIKNQTALAKSPSTVDGYTRAVNQFKESCFKRFMDEITQQDIYDHIGWLRKHLPERKGGGGQRNGTIRTRLSYLSVFFLKNKMENPLPKNEWPKVDERAVEAYTPEEIQVLLSKATDDEYDLILFLLCTGFRDNEAAHSIYDEVSWKAHTITVAPKDEYGFTTKNRKVRVISVPGELIDRLRERRARHPEGALIFPNSKGRPDSALLGRVRAAAKRAGFTGRVTLHKFRKTFGTRYGERHGIVNVQHLLGHADIRTTQKYLAQTKIARSAVEALFEDVVGK
jgi:integrase